MKRTPLLLLVSLLLTAPLGAQVIPADEPDSETGESAPEIFQTAPNQSEPPRPEAPAPPPKPADKRETLPEGEPDVKDKILETGADLLQQKDPLSSLNVYLDGFHFKNGDMSHQMEAHHYCAKLNEHVTQCVIYDENTDHARLIGVEYVVSPQVFKTFSEQERKLWHSHVYEVRSGQLVAPGIPDVVENELMETLVETYGKTWHTWDTSASPFPEGVPALMMGFTDDGQLDPKLLQARDKRMDVSTSEKEQNRESLPAPSVEEGADSWQDGEIFQLKLERQEEKKKANGNKRRQ